MAILEDIVVLTGGKVIAEEVGLTLEKANDRNTGGNPGLTKASEAAKATGAGLAVPPFADDEPGTDWNDWTAIHRKGNGPC